MKLHNVERFFWTARERYNILKAKRLGVSHSWTNDPILSKYRFCNVFREDDKVTAWFRENIRDPLGDDHYKQVRAAVVFRWFNKIETGETLKPFLLGEYAERDVETALRKQFAHGTILGAAYMIKSPPKMDKVDGLLQCIAGVEPFYGRIVKEAQNWNQLEMVHALLQTFDYLGPFMAYQMVCDLRFTPLLQAAVDVDTWTAPGPGSARGIGRVAHDDPKAYKYSSERDIPVLIERMQDLLLYSRNPTYWPKALPKWELSTVQHWLCEYDKYERARTGEGEPKQLYRPASS